MVSSKHAFWIALVFTIIVFIVGLIFGYFLESSRSSKVELALLGSEADILDEQLRSRIISESNVCCDLAKESTFAFADRVYEEALKLEQYDSSSKFDKETLEALHKRYDVLRMMLWMESIKLKERCDNFEILVYFFSYKGDDIKVKAEQSFFSRLLIDIKNAHPDEILLIPIASDLNVSSVDLTLKQYNISKTPSILINEKKVVSEVIKIEEMEDLIFSETAESLDELVCARE
ncbi:MAG: hypothetical protein QXD13_00900 [Candidatus Pacearchaeota archaeon]